MGKHHSRKLILTLRIIGAVLLVVQAIVSTLLIVSLLRIGIFEGWIVGLAICAMVVFVGICITPLFIKHKSLIVVRIICMLLSVVISIGGIFALRYTDAFDAFLEKVSTVEPEVVEEKKEEGLMSAPFVVYISGSDSRTSVDDPEARSDVNLIMVVNPKSEKILIVSIPRDTYVQLHGTEGLKDKLTHAGLYGIEMSKATIEDFLGINIDYTIKVSFDTVISVVDELDGIDIESDKALNLRIENTSKICSFVEGMQHIDGDCALRFARERKSYDTGDIHRGENQQQVLTAIINRFSGSKDYLLKIPEILNVAADSFETSFSRNDIIEFVRSQLSKGTKWQIESIAVECDDARMPTYSMGEDTILFVFIPYEESVQNVKNTINEYLKNE